MQLTHSFTVPADIDRAWDVLLDIERVAPCMPGAALETVDGDDFTGSVKVRLGPIGLTYKGKASFISKDAEGHRAVIDAQGKDARGNGTAKATITATLTARGSGTAVTVVTDLNITGKPAQFGRGVMVDVGNKLIGQFADCLAGKLSELDAGSQDTAVLETAEQLGAVDFDNVERLGTADHDTAELGVSAPDADRSTPASDEVESGAGSPAPDRAAAGGAGLAEPGEPGPSLAEPGLADTDLVEAGLAGLRTPSVTPDSAVAGPGLAQPAPAPTPASRPPAHRPAVAEVEPIDLLGSAGPALAKRLAPVAAGALLIVLLLLRRRRR
ncbi:MAG TPA: SRPBCC family protein [Jatrophihabitans sp.]|jgi:carbon monoxide dehydrogenase subunit G|nr:SRPBCC family protein [Jatrophihabitans sp.]